MDTNKIGVLACLDVGVLGYLDNNCKDDLDVIFFCASSSEYLLEETLFMKMFNPPWLYERNCLI